MSSQLRIGYSFWGFLGDRKIGRDGSEVSTPDGNATYSWSIVWEAMKRGHLVIPLQQERDRHGIEMYGTTLFRAFSQKKRERAYEHLAFKGLGRTDQICWRDGSGQMGAFPELDVLLVEWRFPIPGRNTPDAKSSPWYQPDLERQTELLSHYKTHSPKTKIILWDLDHKLEAWDVVSWLPDAVFETSVKPKKDPIGSIEPGLNVKFELNRIRVEPPFVIDDLLQHPTKEPTGHHMAYVGSRYERDDVIDEWIKPYAAKHPGRVAFHGKWEPKDELSVRWPGIVFHDRIGVTGFYDAYSAAGCVPLLAKRSYMETGFITPRPWEATLFGSLPIGLKGHVSVEDYCHYVAQSPSNLEFISLELKTLTQKQRHEEREYIAHKLWFMDASRFINKIEAVVG